MCSISKNKTWLPGLAGTLQDRRQLIAVVCTRGALPWGGELAGDQIWENDGGGKILITQFQHAHVSVLLCKVSSVQNVTGHVGFNQPTAHSAVLMFADRVTSETDYLQDMTPLFSLGSNPIVTV